MKRRLQGLVAGILIGTTVSSSIVFARMRTENIDVTYNNIKVYKDNVLCELKDANGTTIEPFIYNGTTYMPVRGTANLAGMDVTWDGATQSIYLWDEVSADETYLMDVCPPYDGFCMSTDDFKMAGRNYEGFSLYNNGGAYALVNLNGKYKTMNMEIGPVDGADLSDEPAIVNFYLDGKKVKSIEVEKGDYPKDVSIPLNYALQLKVEMKGKRISTGIGFGNVTLQ